jgi:hypothetical protein
MNRVGSKREFGRVAITLVAAVVVAGLMVGTAWLKRSVPDGSTAFEVGETIILVLVIVGMLIPFIALPIRRAKRDVKA